LRVPGQHQTWGQQSVSKLDTLTADAAVRFARVAAPAKRVLFFSPADDLVYPRKNLTAAIDRGSVSVAFGSRILSRMTVRGVHEYLSDESRYPQPDELVSSVALAMNDTGASRSDVTLVIPKAWAVVKTVEFPKTVRDNLSDVMMYEMDRITPFAAGDAYYDYRIVRENNGRISVLVVAARADVVMPYIHALEEKGIRVNRLMVDLQAMLMFCRHFSSSQAGVFLRIDESGYEGGLRSNGNLVSVFSGSFTDTDGRKRAGMIAADLGAFAGDVASKPSAVILLKDKNPSFKELLKSHLPVPAVFLGETDIRVAFPAPMQNIPFNAVAGLHQSLQPDQLQFNLLRKGMLVRQKTPYLLTVLLLLGILAVSALYVVAPLNIEKKRLQNIATQVTSRKDEVKKVESLQKNVDALQAEISLITGFKKPDPAALNILKEITATLPKTAWITRIKITETTVDIEGYAASANELLPKLEASPLLRKVEFASSTFRDAKMNADRFVIRMEIEGAKKIESVPSAAPAATAVPVPAPAAQKGAPVRNEKK